MTSHTKGPWAIHPSTFYYDVIRAGQDEVASYHKMLPNAEANARLIAAAPDLLEALESISRRWEESDKVNNLACNMVEDARSALAKVKGTP